ncbi:MAG: aspartate dehydrogenase [Notoacmeibacter sp.]|nr:aspartate dehydrogenase [Notoacmeibacter sp.]
MLKKLGIIGAGAITGEMLAVLGRALPERLEELVVLARPGKGGAVTEALSDAASAVASSFRTVECITAMIAAGPDLAVEAAGHSAVSDYVPSLLSAGIETVIASTGALAEKALAVDLEEAARKGGTRLVLASGAVGGMDILAALKWSQVQSVTYTSRKPPSAWKGTPAESHADLTALTSEMVFFEGSARKAAADYPKNANVAATIALAGIGFEQTRVRMIADPGITANVHVFDVVSDAAEISVRIEGKPSPANPKTSLPTVYSLVREVMNRINPIVS